MTVNAVTPDPGDDGRPSVAHIIGLSVGLLDSWHTDPKRRTVSAPPMIPGWHPTARKAATDIIALARKGRAFDALSALHTTYTGHALLHGSVLAVAATLIAQANTEQCTVHDLGQRMLAT